jgi:peptidoglycan/xylan/chitin deacetylase (PgdA/CDA1 family)
MTELSVHAGATETPLPPDFRWPGGKRLAVFFRCAFEGWSDGHWPGVGPMGNPLKLGVPDLNAIGFAEYGHRRGIFRVLDTLKREDVKATMIVSGIMAERHGEIVRRISEEGHDIVAHSYAMDVIPIYLNEDEERANIRRTMDLIVGATGKRPTGWISPRGTPSPRTGRLLAEEGFEWHGDSLNDDLPYLVHFKAGTVVSFSSNMECNDLPLYMRHGNPPRVMLEIFQDWLDYARKYEQGAARIDPTIHSHVFGRPVGMAVFQRMIEIAKQADDIWIGTRSEAVKYILAQQQGAAPRVARG